MSESITWREALASARLQHSLCNICLFVQCVIFLAFVSCANRIFYFSRVALGPKSKVACIIIAHDMKWISEIINYIPYCLSLFCGLIRIMKTDPLGARVCHYPKKS